MTAIGPKQIAPLDIRLRKAGITFCSANIRF
jgi:hypothetical protein